MENKNKQTTMILEGDEAQKRYNEVKEKGLLLYEVIRGSHAYGTNVETSDVDKAFIYIDSLEHILSGNQSLQINLNSDYVGYEIGRYLDLLRTQNPNIIELVNADPKHIEYCHPAFKEFIIDNRDKFLSNKVAFSFGEYARSQIKKAQGTNKKFMNPMEKERKTLLDFCWVGYNQGSISLKKWIDSYKETFHRKLDEMPEWIFGCVAIEHMKNCYHLFIDEASWIYFNTNKDEEVRDEVYARRLFNGIIDKDGVQIKLSPTPKGHMPICTFYCNIEGFSKYCKDYREYWDWIEARNEQRFVENASNENNYDRKNMMHCHRLLDMCIEILKGESVKVYRDNREELLDIRYGKRTYQELVDEAEKKYDKIQELYNYNTGSLPDKCDKDLIDGYLLQLRKNFYGI